MSGISGPTVFATGPDRLWRRCGRRAAGVGLRPVGDAASSNPIVQSAEGLSERWQRLVGRDAHAQEFSAADISPTFKVNGTREPMEAEYQAHVADNFANWKLAIGGLVNNPISLGLDQLRRMPARTQITRHDCVEGWSAIGQWTGVPLGQLLKAADMKTNARYIVFRCADNYGGELSKGGAQSTSIYYESIDLVDAFHPQTILAHSMNGAPLSVGHGAPVRMRIERQLGYKAGQICDGHRRRIVAARLWQWQGRLLGRPRL